MIEQSFICRWARIPGNILYYQQLCLGRIDCQSNLRKNINSPIIIALPKILAKLEAQTDTRTYNIQNKHDYPYSLILLSSFKAENFIGYWKDTKPPPILSSISLFILITTQKLLMHVSLLCIYVVHVMVTLMFLI